MEAGADQWYSSPTDVSNSMSYEQSWSTPKHWAEPWIFWSRQKNELQNIFDSLYLNVDTPSSRNTTVAEKIKAFLQYLLLPSFGDHLIQFWAPVKTTGDRIYLTTADQPFGLTKFHKGLCSYRRLCVSRILIPVDVNEMGDEGEHNFGFLARVFRQRIRESGLDMSHYPRKEYPNRSYFVHHVKRSFCALPIFESVGRQCIGVLEILSTPECYFENVVNFVDYKPEHMNVTCTIPWAFSYNFEDLDGMNRAYKVMEDTCRNHQLPFAQIWAASSTTRAIDQIFHYQLKPSNHFSTLGVCRMWEGKGVVGKAFALRSACLCNNISELSISVYPLVPNLQNLGLARCFAVCLQSTQVDDVFYILEFFLPRSDRDLRNTVSMLVATLKEKIQSMGAHVKKLGEKLFVEVIKTSFDDELDSFEICDTAQVRSTMGSKVTRGERNGIGNYSKLQPSSPFSVQEVGLGMQLNDSVVESNSPSSVQEMSLDLHLGLCPLGSVRGDAVVQQNSPSPVQEMSLGIHLGYGPRLEAEEDVMSSSSVRNYSVVQRRSPTPGMSQFISNNDSDFTDINAVLQIFGRAKRRRGMFAFDMSNG